MNSTLVDDSAVVVGEHKLNCCIKKEPLTERFSVEGEIGRGKFAVVKKLKCKTSGQEYAAKFIRKRRKGKDCRHEILHEIVMLEMALAHPRLVDLKEVYETSHELVLITEYAAGGELFHHCVVEETFKEKDVIKIMRQILEGLIFLHDRHIVHLDLKPQNILLTTKSKPYGDVKLCDFGFARLVNTGEDIRDIIGTPDYVAPEVLSYEPITTSTDMWSVGVLAYVMLTGHSPFTGDTKQETFLNISQVSLEFPDDLFCDISKHAQDFISKCLVKNPKDRIAARECLQHTWLKCHDELHPPSSPALRSPLGSPLGCRRSHQQTNSPNGLNKDIGTPKKFKYNNENEKLLNGEHTTCLNNNLNKLPELTEEQLVCY